MGTVAGAVGAAVQCPLPRSPPVSLACPQDRSANLAHWGALAASRARLKAPAGLQFLLPGAASRTEKKGSRPMRVAIPWRDRPRARVFARNPHAREVFGQKARRRAKRVLTARETRAALGWAKRWEAQIPASSPRRERCPSPRVPAPTRRRKETAFCAAALAKAIRPEKAKKHRPAAVVHPSTLSRATPYREFWSRGNRGSRGSRRG
jgi:hypothetical protein